MNPLLQSDLSWTAGSNSFFFPDHFARGPALIPFIFAFHYLPKPFGLFHKNVEIRLDHVEDSHGCRGSPKPGSHMIVPIVLIVSIVCKINTGTIVGEPSDWKRSGVLIWSSRSYDKSEDLDPTQLQPSLKEQDSWPPFFSVIAVLRRRKEREAKRIEHGRSKRSWSPQSPQTLAIVWVMFSYNRPNRKKTFWSDRSDMTETIGAIIWEAMRSSLKEVSCIVETVYSETPSIFDHVI